MAWRAVAFPKVRSPHRLERLTITHPEGSRERRSWQVGGGSDRNLVEPATAWKVWSSPSTSTLSAGNEWPAPKTGNGVAPGRMPATNQS